MNILRLIVRIITGMVFIFSGFVKGIDPLGSTYKFNDYFEAFNLGFLTDFSLALALLLCAAEFIVGLSLVTGYKIKAGIWGAAIFMLIFTPLTFILAMSNPVSDCGCFGDAIKLTNWETFFKNIVISLFVIILFSGLKRIQEPENTSKGWIVLLISFIVFNYFSYLNYKHLPLIDFLPYRVGTSIPEKMVIPDGAPSDEYSITFIYEKNGVKKEFTLDDYPANDTSWVFIDQNSKIISKGYEPPIHDFNFASGNGDDLTDLILKGKGYTVLMVIKKISEASPDDLQKGFNLGAYCMTNNINFYILTSSSPDEVSEYENGLQFCFGDEITLKTMVRANPGFILLNEGTITGKWAIDDLPENGWFSGNLNGKQLDNYSKTLEILSTISIGLLLVVLLLLLPKLLNKSAIKTLNK